MEYTNDDLIKLLDRCAELIAKGSAEGVYEKMVAGQKYADHTYNEIYSHAIKLLEKQKESQK